MSLIYYSNKRECIAAIKAAGYTIETGVGQCGDYAHGSRVYFAHPVENLNQFNVNMNSATASKTSGGWYASYFGEESLMPEAAR